jgi:sRNA-binding regulator protein Hfq
MSWLLAACGQLVRLHLTTGKVLVGQLRSVDRAALVVQGSGAVPLLVYKHSVSYIALEEPEDRR